MTDVSRLTHIAAGPNRYSEDPMMSSTNFSEAKLHRTHRNGVPVILFQEKGRAEFRSEVGLAAGVWMVIASKGTASPSRGSDLKS